jgi:hypothetical protein
MVNRINLTLIEKNNKQLAKVLAKIEETFNDGKMVLDILQHHDSIIIYSNIIKKNTEYNNYKKLSDNDIIFDYITDKDNLLNIMAIKLKSKLYQCKNEIINKFLKVANYNNLVIEEYEIYDIVCVYYLKLYNNMGIFNSKIKHILTNETDLLISLTGDEILPFMENFVKYK